MQLNKPASLRQALAAATCSLFAGAHPAAHAQEQTAAPGQWAIDSALLFYSEQDRVRVIEPVVRMRKQLTEDESIGARLVLDSLTGSSPNGAVPSTAPQTFTSPSGEKTYTTPANEIPLDPTFRDQRVALSGDWSRPFGEARRVVYEGHLSKEHDYASLGLGATFTQDLNKRNTTLTAGLSFSGDGVDPIGGVPVALSVHPIGTSKETTGDAESKTVTEALLGVTQVINRTTLMQLNYTYGRDAGYLTDPYKLVSVVDNNGLPVETLYEKRPDSRARQALYWRTVKAFGRDVLNFSYRYYRDDWGVAAHTADLRYRLDLGGHYIEPHARYSQQARGADFYRAFLRQGETVDFVSADYRLSEMTTATVGLKYGIAYKSGEIAVRLEYMTQTGEDRPAGAPGQLASQDLFPDTKATLLQANFSFLW